jgi:electron transfer flavoprotein alpha subunit
LSSPASTDTPVKDRVWVFLEVQDGTLAPVSRELLGRARELAEGLDGSVAGVLLGSGVAELAAEAIAAGADRVYLAEDPRLAEYATLPYARVIGDLVQAAGPEVVLFGATPVGRDLAPRLASLLETGLTADCTDLRVVPASRQKPDEPAGPLLHQIRPAFGGNIVATIVTPRHRPQMATVRPGVFSQPAADPGRPGRVFLTPVELPAEDLVVEVLAREKKERRVNLTGARVVVAGGAGVGSAEGFALIRELARTLGGVVGATRAAVDAGWIDREHQIGQTGVTVRPKLYVAAGISGSVQHSAGMSESARILAINTDPDAPIFAIAHYGIVGDLRDVIPRMIRAYQADSAARAAAAPTGDTTDGGAS